MMRENFVMMAIKNQWLAICLLLVSGIASAEIEEDGRYWLNLYMQGKLPVENLYWSMDTHPRWRNEGEHFDTLILRPSVFYKLIPKASVWLGYDTVINHPAGKSSYTENRLWEQFMYQFDPVGEVSLTSRSRIEHRDREGFSDVAHRWRQMLRAVVPSGLHSQFSWVVYDELFVNLNTTDWIQRRGIDQNRLFLGGNWKFSPMCNGEMGYLNQFVNARNSDQDNHVLLTTVRLSF